MNKKPKVVGIYRLIMKSGSDNFRASAIQGIMRRLSEAGVKLFLFEPSFNEDKFFTADVIRDINEFKSVSDVIVTNRWNDDLLDVKDKVFTRDLFFNNWSVTLEGALRRCGDVTHLRVIVSKLN